MIKAPPDRQVASLLTFLTYALQHDSVLQTQTESTATDIVAYAANYQPLQRADGKVWLYVSQLPALCFHVTSAAHRRRGGRWGRILSGNLWYLFQTPQSESDSIHGLTKAERFKGLIDWRLNYWLHKQTVTDDFNGDGDDQTYNLQTEGLIRLLTVGDSDWFNEGNIEGLRMDLTIEHYWAPYTETGATTVELYEVDIIEKDDGRIGQLKVEATIDV